MPDVQCFWGLSPRVRGNRVTSGVLYSLWMPGSIPACAGEPQASAQSGVRISGLSPRVRGNQHLRYPVGWQCNGKGLSPRVRGNPSETAWPCKPSFRVYPRVCGGTRGFQNACSIFEGGSIPACAGEPGSNLAACLRARVYPRVCGGTRVAPSTRAGEPSRGCIDFPPGVYPRVCGGTSGVALSMCRPSSIRVYPRVCGGTSCS